MGIWIRTQNKKSLINCTDIRIVTYKDSCTIWDYKVDEVLGKYETEERALEVLGEIQGNIAYIELVKIRDAYPINEDDFIYEMPQEKAPIAGKQNRD